MSAVLMTVVLAAWAGAMAQVAQRPALLEFHLVDDQNNPVRAQQSGAVPSGDKLYKEQDGTPILLRREAVATSDEITNIVAATTQDGPAIDIRLDARGAASMLSTTRANLGHELATMYNGQVINHAVIQGIFGRRFQVTGLTVAEAHAIAMRFTRATE